MRVPPVRVCGGTRTCNMARTSMCRTEYSIYILQLRLFILILILILIHSCIHFIDSPAFSRKSNQAKIKANIQMQPLRYACKYLVRTFIGITVQQDDDHITKFPIIPACRHSHSCDNSRTWAIFFYFILHHLFTQDCYWASKHLPLTY